MGMQIMQLRLLQPITTTTTTTINATSVPIPIPSSTSLTYSFRSFFVPSSSSFISLRAKPNKELALDDGSLFGSISTKTRRSIAIATRRRRREHGIMASSKVATPFFDGWKPDNSAASPSLSDILWPSAGAFAAMALLGKMDQILAPKGLSMTIAPLGAVCAVLFTTPSSPAARKYNMFMAQIGCAAIGVVAFTIFGPGWLARSAALAASIAFMLYTRSTHPPAASLPILFIDGAKMHHLNIWFAFFPGAAGCILLCLIQEMVSYLKNNFKF